MSTVFLGELPAAIDDWLDRRRRLGQDRFDEVWAGEYHVAPGPSAEHAQVDSEVGGSLRHLARGRGLVTTTAFNLGRSEDYRVPDGGLHRARPSGVYVETAAAVVEVLSPGDETFAKFGFYADHGVEEIIVADPATRTVRVWRSGKGGGRPYEEVDRSHLLDVTAASLTEAIDWP